MYCKKQYINKFDLTWYSMSCWVTCFDYSRRHTVCPHVSGHHIRHIEGHRYHHQHPHPPLCIVPMATWHGWRAVNGAAAAFCPRSVAFAAESWCFITILLETHTLTSRMMNESELMKLSMPSRQLHTHTHTMRSEVPPQEAPLGNEINTFIVQQSMNRPAGLNNRRKQTLKKN